MKSFKVHLTEAVKLTPKELSKPNSATGESRIEILRKEIQAGNPLELATGGFFVVTNIPQALKSIEQFKKDGKPFELLGANGSIKSSALAKSKVFGGGGGAGGGAVQTAIAESAQCVWIQAMFEHGIQPLEFYTDDVLTKAFRSVDVGKTKLDDILKISDSWINSSYIIAKHLIENGFVRKGMVCHRDSALMKSVYSAKNQALKSQGLSKISDDKWNPGDIWVADKSFRASELPTDNLGSLNDKLVELFNSRKLVGISLKLVKKNPKHQIYNVEKTQGKLNQFKSVETSSRRGNFWSAKNGTIETDGGTLMVAANSYFGTHKAELTGKTARGGGIGWGPIMNYSQTTLRRKIPNNRELVKLAKSIDKGDERSIKKLWLMVQKLVPQMKEEEFRNELAKKDVGWIHAKLGVIHLGYAILSNPTGSNKFVTQLINYAGSKLEESSAYVKVFE